MPDYFVGTGSARKRLPLTPPFASGAAGAIHHVVGQSGVVAKVYLNASDRDAYARKVTTMLAHPPRLDELVEKGRRCVQIAWPTEAITDDRDAFAGFLMPEVDFKRSQMLENVLQKGTRQIDGIPEFYGFRVLLAANLAAVMAKLHALGHYMIDMKPENMRFYPDSWFMAILDTDGFSIKGSKSRIPSDQVSDNYIAPEAKGKLPKDLGQAQDLFALAVIIFRLLNNGIHPYQGVSRGGASLPRELQARIFDGLYAYGVRQHGLVAPKTASLHEMFEDETRKLFDRAFEADAVRPTAAAWRDHLKDLVSIHLVKCSKKPNEHGHFSKGCGHCAEERRIAGRASAQARPAGRPAAAPSQQISATSIAALNVASAASQPAATPSSNTFKLGVWGWIGIAGIAGALLFGLASGLTPASSSSASADTAAAATTDAAAAAVAEAAAAPPASATSPAPAIESLGIRYFSSARAFVVRPGEGAVSVNLRDGPGADYSTVRTLGARQQVWVLGEVQGTGGLTWFYVQASDLRGFIKASLLRDPAESAPTVDTMERSDGGSTEPSSQTPPRSLRGRASVLNVDRLNIGGRSIQLYGVRPGPGSSVAGLSRLVGAGQPIQCSLIQGAAYRCVTASGVDLAETAVLNGLAYASGSDYREVESEAKRLRVGVWEGSED